MAHLRVFNSVTLDGYFAGPNGDISWAHKMDPEWNEFVSGNAQGGGALVFGRVTYDMMVRFWPTAEAMKTLPAVAEGMNNAKKFVFSRTLDSVSWKNTTLLKGDPATEMQKLKAGTGPDMVILGSGSIVAQLAGAGLIDEYQIVLNPTALGAGRTMFEGIQRPVSLRLAGTRAFQNGNVVLSYARAE